MRKFKLFIENFVLYGIGGVISKVIPLIMLPIVTRLMPNSFYFGLNDLSSTVVSFGSAIAIAGMYDSMFRMFFEKEDEKYKKDICSTALLFTIFTSTIVFIFLIIFRKQLSEVIFSDRKYANLLFLTAMSILIGATNSIVQAPTRMQNKRKIFLILNTLSPMISYSISIPLLIKGEFVIALPLASVITAFILEIAFGIINRKWFKFSGFNIHYLKQMLVIAIPLLPNFLVYWVFNSCDRLMIAKLLGNEFTGIYAIGSKLGNMSQLIYIAFAGGWQYFAFSTMKEQNQVKSNSMIFEYLGVISFAATSLVAGISKLLFQVLFEGDYIIGYTIAPYLFLAPLLQMLFQVACNQFLVVKKTWPNMLILSLGAILNIVVNFIFIPVWGIEGAAFATLMGYVVSDIICVIILKRMKLMIISKRFLISVILFAIFLIIWRLILINYTVIGTGVALVLIGFYLVMYRGDYILLFEGKKEYET